MVRHLLNLYVFSTLSFSKISWKISLVISAGLSVFHEETSIGTKTNHWYVKLYSFIKCNIKHQVRIDINNTRKDNKHKNWNCKLQKCCRKNLAHGSSFIIDLSCKLNSFFSRDQKKSISNRYNVWNNNRTFYVFLEREFVELFDVNDWIKTGLLTSFYSSC